jgi:hypothetical protein
MQAPFELQSSGQVTFFVTALALDFWATCACSFDF